MLKRVCLFAMLVLLSSCGFHLRGFHDMPAWLDKVAIVIQDAHRDLGPMLKNQLEAYHIQVVPEPAAANYVLLIESDGIQQQMTNVAASTAPRQYQLIYDVRFTLLKTKGAAILPSHQVFVTRQLTVNSNLILGSNSEEAQLSYEMRHDAAIQIMNRISREKKILPSQKGLQRKK